MRKNRKRNIKWRNIALTIILLICALIVIHDLYVIVLEPFVTSVVRGWTWYGFGTFIIALIVGGCILDYFSDEINRK